MWRLCICWLNCICFTLITAWNNYKPPHWNILKENLPNLSVVGTEGNKQFEVQWNDRESKVSMNLMKETYTHLFCASYHGLFWLPCYCCIFGYFEFSSKAGILDILMYKNWHLIFFFFLIDASHKSAWLVAVKTSYLGARPAGNL